MFVCALLLEFLTSDPDFWHESLNVCNYFVESVATAFSLPDNDTFDLVVNCAAETKLGQSESVSSDSVAKN